MKQYRPRIADALLREKLEAHGAVLVEGAKWCGKTTTAAQQARSILYMQEPERVARNLELAVVQPSLLLQGAVPHLIDEWQMAPQLWDAVRYEVDRRDEFGQFILTGSVTPADRSLMHHSGIGRIVPMLMRTMSLFESGDSTGEVSLRALAEGQADISGHAEHDIERIAYLICRGGWPRALGCSEKVALRQATAYYDTVLQAEMQGVDGVRRNPQRVERFLRAYARAVSSQASIQSLVKDMKANDEQTLNADTIASYIDVLKNIFVIEESEAWNLNLRSKTAIRTTNTRYFTDPSIGTAALGIGPRDLVDDLNTMGLFFENLCVRDLRTYAEALEGTVYHYRDKSGLECDAVVHLRNGTYGLVEVKLGGAANIEAGAATLTKLESRINTAGMKPPAFKMVLTGTDDFAYRRKDGIFVVPIGALRD